MFRTSSVSPPTHRRNTSSETTHFVVEYWVFTALYTIATFAAAGLAVLS
ncbi:hypothetical protein [Bradyrhizobium sp.]|nr:hypothetical protein [Bradyrhizobium sp.]